MADVGRENLEFDKLDVDDRMLAQIAAQTGGRYVHLSTAATLIDQLDRTAATEERTAQDRPLSAGGTVLGDLRRPAQRRVVPAAEVLIAMSRQTGYRYLEPTALARVKNLALVARGVVEGSISGLHASPYKGYSVEFAEHRQYTAGDDPRHLDYKMLARTERLYIKQYEEETNMRVQVLLDTSGSMGYSHDGRITKLQYGSYLTAILAYLMTRQQDSVGLTTFDTEIRLDMPARGSPRHFNEMMRQLEADRAGPADGHRRDAPQAGQPLQAPLPDRAGQRPLRRAGGGDAGACTTSATAATR